MQIKLENIIPIPLKENLQYRSSDIWNTTQVFNAGEWVNIKAPSGTGKTTLTTKVLFKFFGQENIGLISNNNLFGLENIINKKCIICDEAHHYSFNGGQILKLLEKG